MRLFPLWMCFFLGLLVGISVLKGWWLVAAVLFCWLLVWMANEVCERLRPR